jgi:hypothetical protein
MKKVVAGCVAVLVVAGVPLAASAAGKAGAAAKSMTIQIVEKNHGFNFVDNPPKGGGPNDPPTIGDQLAFDSTLLTKSGKRAGHLEATCTVTTGGRNGYSACVGVFALRGGTLSLIAMAPLNQAGPANISIVGGTGVYEGATGSIKSVSRGENSPYTNDTVHLILPT